jgi:hypothetical protein
MPQMETHNMQGEFMNVAERFSLYDSICVVGNYDARSRKPLGWYSTFAAFAGGNHSFFNVRNKGSCELAYCNIDTRDQMAYAMILDSISCAWWGTVYAMYDADEVADSRFWLPLPLWQSVIPSHASLTLVVQQDEKIKINSMMAGAGYGPVGGGYGNIGQCTISGQPQNPLDSHWPNMLTQTQGEALPSAAMPFPNKIAVPRRATMSVQLDLADYAVGLLSALQGPGTLPVQNPSYSDTNDVYVMYGVTVRLNGRRLVQQRGELHA